MSRHEWERAFEKFANISKMLQPSPSAKMDGAVTSLLLLHLLT